MNAYSLVMLILCINIGIAMMDSTHVFDKGNIASGVQSESDIKETIKNPEGGGVGISSDWATYVFIVLGVIGLSAVTIAGSRWSTPQTVAAMIFTFTFWPTYIKTISVIAVVATNLGLDLLAGISIAGIMLFIGAFIFINGLVQMMTGGQKVAQ